MGVGEQEHRVSREGWPPGPWDGEGDKYNWTTKSGLPGMIVRNQLGALCGYVAVAEGHPMFGRHYDEAADISVHGGLTYSNHCADIICHIPAPGQPDNVWWLGFDCLHCDDAAPGGGGLFYERLGRPTTYRDLAYVRAEVESLADQLAACVPGEAESPKLG